MKPASELDKSPTTPAATSCPVCRSKQVSTSNKSQRLDAYWRCEACGHIWNPARGLPGRRVFL